MSKRKPISVAVWDALVWLTIILPVLTGGIWIHRPGLKVELTQINAQVFVLSLIGFFVFSVLRFPLQETSSIRFLTFLWKTWKGLVENKGYKALLVGALLVAILFAAASIRRHLSFGSGAADLGIFTNAIWNLTHANGYVSSVKDGINLFADHQSPVFWLFAPVFWLFPSPNTLLIVQALGLALGAIAVYVLAKQYLPSNPEFRAALPLIYWAYLPLRNANAFDFHPEVFILPAFLAAIAAIHSTKSSIRLLGVFFLILGLMGKESSGPLAVGLGIAWMLGASPVSARSFSRIVGIVLVIAGATLFVFDTQVVPKLAGAGAYAYDSHYADFGQGLTSLIFAPFSKTELFFSRVFGPARLTFMWATIAPLGFLPLVGWKPFISSYVCYLMLFLGVGDHRIAPIYHYAIEPAVGLFWGLVLGISVLISSQTLRLKWLTPKRLLLWLLFWSLVLFGRSEVFRIRYFSPTGHMKWLRAEVLPAVNEKVTVAASGALVAHLATRKWVHHLPKIENPKIGMVDCVFYDSELNQWPLPSQEIPNFLDEINAKGYRQVYSCNSFKAFQNQRSQSECLMRSPVCPGLK